jgi:Zn-dependent peptidase ImmA (M78 family)
MVLRVAVEPTLLTWAADRARIEPERLHRLFPDFDLWRSGAKKPTFKQLEKFARTTHAPFGYMFLKAAPLERLPISDFRTIRNMGIQAPSPDLLETINICQARQDWYKAFALGRDYEALPFVGTLTTRNPVEVAADVIRRSLGFELDRRSQFGDWEAALRQLIDSIEDMGVLVMVSGIVGGNTHRVLDPSEFRGFALSDTVAPLIFINGADTKAAQIFTLVHELAHVWLGETGLSDVRLAAEVENDSELWCNRVAAEVLIPIAKIRAEFRGTANVDELKRLARVYRVSTLVVLKRIFDAGFIGWDDYRDAYETERDRVMAIVARQRSRPGGNYYNTQPLRISRHFARAVIVDTFEGRTLHRDAYGLLGTAKHETFVNLAKNLGVA